LSAEFPFFRAAGHLFARIDGDDWLVDTGSPLSLGSCERLHVGGIGFPISPSGPGWPGPDLSALVGHPCAGVIGAQILNAFYVVFDEVAGVLRFCDSMPALDGEWVAISLVTGVPVVQATVGGIARRMFIGTGARLSYFQHHSLADHPSAGTQRDFLPGAGVFEIATHRVPVAIGPLQADILCGTLPGIVGAMLAVSGTAGIIGNEVFAGRQVGYFPRSNLVVFGEPTV
jgi:hypothetical protein